MANDPMKPGERLDYSAIVDREPLKFPNNARIIIWPVLALEVWDISRAMPRTVLPPPQGNPLLPDVPNWSWHEYGMRVAIWRIIELFDEFKIPPTVTLNGRTCEEYPRVAEACLERNWEFNAHAYEQLAMHKVEDQKENIDKTIAAIEKFTGSKPRGWFGPGLTQTYETLDLLAESGLEYIGDWVLDDLPVKVKTTSKDVVALPYNFEIHDIAQQMIQYHDSKKFYKRSKDYFDTLYEEGEKMPRIMAFAVHPYISGSPHRIKYVRKALEYMTEKPDVAIMDGAQILDWYLEQDAPV